MSTKFLLAVLATTVVGFFGGWLIFGMALAGFYEEGSTEAALALHKSEEDMVFWAMIVGQLAWGILITWVVDKSDSPSLASGAVAGAILLGLVALGMDLFFYAMMNMYEGATIMVVDVIVNVIYGGIIGAVAGWILSRGES